jgi:hypothetical protein
MHKKALFRGARTAAGQINRTLEVECEAESNLDLDVPVGNNQLTAFVLDVSQLKFLYIVAAGALTIKTNSSGSPANTITLAADVPFQWILGDNALRDTANAAITTDITALYITNAGEAPVNLQLLSGFDPTV